uniref:Integrin subunit alpha X n=1 Tax=Pseudonaja textilis TaxID=8673 RepID=A0A670YNQ7_PSETE
PTVHRACGENTYVNGYCFLLDQNLQEKEHFPESLPKCTRHPTDIAFLIDGSSSISEEDFEKMKRFVSEVIKNLSGRDTLFALMQFSGNFREHFNFNSQDSAQLVMKVKQLYGWTKTATAIRKVVRELFIAEKGSRNSATKILIVITDGSKLNDDAEYWEVIPEAEQAGIIRYAIGVGSAFSTIGVQQELKDIASEPDDEHVFKVNNFNALKTIQEQLQNKIFAIEGLVIGAVGAYDWSGGLLLYQTGHQDPEFINISSILKYMNNSYLGYSSQPVQFHGRNGLVVGAPRYDHIGKVVYFENEALSREWRLKMEAVGEQVGSYFGATLCSVDLNQDTNTDLVLVGAPMYYDATAGGRVHISFSCTNSHRALKGEPGHLFGRFGASIAEVGDITGDKWTDVAIGAPLEDENAGAVYIFSGKRASINRRYVQRIQGLKFSGRFSYFGQAISGGRDLTGDGLKDIIVGQQGRVLLLRSRPVLQVKVSIVFHPPSIPTSVFQWQRPTSQENVTSMAEVCFTISKVTQDFLGDGKRCSPLGSYSNPHPSNPCSVDLNMQKKYLHNLRLLIRTQRFFPSLPLSLQTLDVGLTPEFTVTASLQNQGEDSYGSTLRFFYPAGLSYRKVTLLQQVTRVQCHSSPTLEEAASWNVTCNINHPIFWSGAIFVATFDVSPDADLGDTLQIVVKADRYHPCSWVLWVNKSQHYSTAFEELVLDTWMPGLPDWVQLLRLCVSCHSQVQTVVERIEIYNSFPIIIGSSFGGLILLALSTAALYKVGFFKRQYKQMLEEAGAGNDTVDTSSQNVDSSPPSNDTVS